MNCVISIACYLFHYVYDLINAVVSTLYLTKKSRSTNWFDSKSTQKNHRHSSKNCFPYIALYLNFLRQVPVNRTYSSVSENTYQKTFIPHFKTKSWFFSTLFIVNGLIWRDWTCLWSLNPSLTWASAVTTQHKQKV